MQEQPFSIIRLEDWKEFSPFIQQFSSNWAFRGQADSCWLLSNAIERTGFIKHHVQVEKNFVEEFQRGASNYLTKDNMPEKLIEWLALMQHHGAPTRLLDLSKSPFISAYFAYEYAVPVEDLFVSVWGINVNYLKRRSLEVMVKEVGEELAGDHHLINEPLFETIIERNDIPLVFPVEPFRMNRRYSLQQSIFLCTGIAEQPFMDQLLFLGEEVKQAVIRIDIPAICKAQALRDLQQMNLNRASLFPDLDGYAASLRLRYESMQTPEEGARLQLQLLGDRHFPYIP